MRERVKAGFTLAEVLIVVAIISILVAVSIPIFTSQLKKAREATCLANRTSLQHHIAVDLMSGENDKTVVTEDILKKYQENDGAYCPEGGTYSITLANATLTDGFTVTCSKHGDLSLGNATIRDEVVNILVKIHNGTIDSTAGDYSNYLPKVKKALKDAGLDLEAMGAKYWRWDGRGDKFLYWTDQDIGAADSPAVGEKVPMIRYNVSSGNYTVWYGKVTENTLKGHTYKYLTQDSSYAPSTSTTDNGNQSYEKALEYLKEAQNQKTR